jgi:ElaB/YqjD/DUF883 family membrane-anchored ribosome-binding protein
MKHNGGQHNEPRRPDEILAEIERTRHDMDSTLTAIEHRLTPGQLFDQGVAYLRESGGHEFVQNLGTQAKNNPMPIALVGIGLAWLMASGKNPPARYGTSDYGPSLGERAGELGHKISGTTHAVEDRMRQARDTLSSAGRTARERMNSARDSMDYMMREHPLALGAIGVAIGAVVAAMAPRTRKEDELMGDTRDRLLDQAKEAGKEKLEQAKEVAHKAVGAATKEAEQRGLKPSSQWAKSDFDKTASPMPSTSIEPFSGSGRLP